MTTRGKPVLDPDEILDRIGDREPTEEEARLFMDALGITADEIVARVHASAEAAQARDTDPAPPPPSVAPANDTLPPPAMKRNTPRRWVPWAVAAAIAAAVIGATGAFAARVLDLAGVSPHGGWWSQAGKLPDVTPCAVSGSIGVSRAWEVSSGTATATAVGPRPAGVLPVG